MIYKNRKHIPLGKYLLNNLSFKNYYVQIKEQRQHTEINVKIHTQ